MLRFFLICLPLAFFSCSSESDDKSKNETEISESDQLPYDENTPDSVIAETSDADSQAEILPGGKKVYEFDYIVVANTLRGRDKPSTNGTPTNSFAFGTLLKFKDQSEERDVLNLGSVSGACDDYGYHWVKVEDKDGNQAWGYGQFLFKINWNESEDPFQYDGETYYFGSQATAISYGPSDQDGLTGCDDLEMPFFYKKNSDKVYPVIANQKMEYSGMNHFITGFDANVLLLMSGEGGGSDLITAKQLEDGRFYIKYMNGYQEGSNESEVWLKFDGKQFTIDNIKNSERDY